MSTYRLRDLLEWDVDREIKPGVWVSARPLDGPSIWRWRAAWSVLRGRADAFTWPTADDPQTWCSTGSVRTQTLAGAVGATRAIPNDLDKEHDSGVS